MIIQFTNFQLDTDLCELRKDGLLLHVEPRVFDLIAELAAHPDKVFSNDELIEAVWDDRIVSGATIAGCVKHARKILGDTGHSQKFIKTVRGRGFRFVAPITQAHTLLTETSRPATAQAPQSVSTWPSLLVVPFRSLSTTKACALFANTLASRVGTVLTRIPLLRLHAQSFHSQESGENASARERHEEYGVDYVLDGTVQVQDQQLQIGTQLTDARTGFSLWAEYFVVTGNVADGLDQSVTTIIGKLEPQLHRAIYDSVRSSDGKPNAHELFLEASGRLALKGWHHASFPVASQLLRRSCQLAPEFAHAAGYLSLVLGLGHRLGLLEDRDRVRDEAYRAAEMALELDNMDSSVLGLAGCALADLGQPGRALPILNNAIELNPLNAQAWAALGTVNLGARKIDVAVENLRHGIRISPLDSRLSVWGGALATALRVNGDLDDARIQAELACQRDDRTYMPRVILAAIHLASDEPLRAKDALHDAYRIKPDLSVAQIAYLAGNRSTVALQKLM